MEYTVTWGGDPEDVLIETFGAASTPELNEMTMAVAADPRIRSGMSVLIDHSRTDWSSMSIADIRLRAEQVAGAERRIGLLRVAFVASRDVDFGLGRMLETLISDRIGFPVGVFRSPEEARAWLRAEAA